MPAEDLAATLAAGLMRPADAEGSTRACTHEPPAWWADYDLLYETLVEHNDGEQTFAEHFDAGPSLKDGRRTHDSRQPRAGSGKS